MTTPAHIAVVHKGQVVYAVRFFGGDGTYEGNVRASASREKAFAYASSIAERLGAWPTTAAFPEDLDGVIECYHRIQAKRAGR